MDSLKKVNAIIAVVLTLAAVGIWMYWKSICASEGCDPTTREFIMRPLLWGSAVWAILSATLLAFPSAVFKKWLYYVASWGILLTLYAVLSTDPRSSGVLSIDRGQAAWFAGIVMAGISALFILGWYTLTRIRHTAPPAPVSSLLSLFPAAAVLYYLSVM